MSNKQHATYPPIALSQDYGVLDTAFLLEEFKKKWPVVIRFAVTLAALSLVFTIKPHFPTVKATLRVDPPAGAAGIANIYNVDTEIGSIKSYGMVSDALERASYYAIVKSIHVDEVPSKERGADDKPGALHFHQLFFPPAMSGRKWMIEILDNNRYVLKTEQGELIAEAGVGEVVTGIAESQSDHQRSGKYSIEVSAIEALPGSTFFVEPMQPDALIRTLLGKLDVTKRYSNAGSNLLDIELSLPDVTLAYHLVQYLAEHYILLSMERQSAAQKQAIRKLESQLEELQQDVNTHKKALFDFYAVANIAEPQLEMENLVPKRTALENAIQNAQIKLQQLRLVYTGEHPSVKALEQEIALLSSELDGLNRSIARLPTQQSTLDQLKRELEISTDLYQTAIKELARVQLQTNSLPQNVHLIDPPRVHAPQRTKYIMQLIIFGGMLGFISGMALVLLSASVRLGRLHSLAQLTKLTRLPVNQEILTLRRAEPDADSRERLGQLAQYSYHHTEQQWFGLSAASQDSDTATLSVTFAAALANEQKVLLIDAHLYDSPLAPMLGRTSMGLSEVLTGRCELSRAVQSTPHSGLSYLAAGKELLNYELLRDGEAVKALLANSDYQAIILYLPEPNHLPDPASILHQFDRLIHWLKIGQTLESIQRYLLHFDGVQDAQGLFVYESVKKRAKRIKASRGAKPPKPPKPPRPQKSVKQQPIVRPPSPTPTAAAPAGKSNKSDGKPKRVFTV